MKYLVEFRDKKTQEPIYTLDTIDDCPPFQLGDYIVLNSKDYKIIDRRWIMYHDNELSILFLYVEI